MFKSRKKRTVLFYTRELLWPSMGWKRAARYIGLRVMRLAEVSDSVPRGIACGVSASFFPVIGVHAVIAVAIAIAIRANPVAAAVGTLVFPPVVLPAVFSLDFMVGQKILDALGFEALADGQGFLAASAKGLHHMLEHFSELFVPALVGGGIFMLLMWPASYMLTHWAIGLLRRHHGRKD